MPIDLDMRSITARAARAFVVLLQLVRGFRIACAVRLLGGDVGRGLRAEGGVSLRHLPSKHWKIGDHVYFGRGVILDIEATAIFKLGDGVKLMHYTVVGASEAVTIGDHTQIGEHTSVRDANHRSHAGMPLWRSGLIAKPVKIGSDVWIGRGVAVLAGSEIGDGAVIGANSVVLSVIQPRSIAVGAPAVVRSTR